jgi:hypothetical protein
MKKLAYSIFLSANNSISFWLNLGVSAVNPCGYSEQPKPILVIKLTPNLLPCDFELEQKNEIFQPGRHV